MEKTKEHQSSIFEVGSGSHKNGHTNLVGNFSPKVDMTHMDSREVDILPSELAAELKTRGTEVLPSEEVCLEDTNLEGVAPTGLGPNDMWQVPKKMTSPSRPAPAPPEPISANSFQYLEDGMLD